MVRFFMGGYNVAQLTWKCYEGKIPSNANDYHTDHDFSIKFSVDDNGNISGTHQTRDGFKVTASGTYSFDESSYNCMEMSLVWNDGREMFLHGQKINSFYHLAVSLKNPGTRPGKKGDNGTLKAFTSVIDEGSETEFTIIRIGKTDGVASLNLQDGGFVETKGGMWNLEFKLSKYGRIMGEYNDPKGIKTYSGYFTIIEFMKRSVPKLKLVESWSDGRIVVYALEHFDMTTHVATMITRVIAEGRHQRGTYRGHVNGTLEIIGI